MILTKSSSLESSILTSSFFSSLLLSAFLMPFVMLSRVSRIALDSFESFDPEAELDPDGLLEWLLEEWCLSFLLCELLESRRWYLWWFELVEWTTIAFVGEPEGLRTFSLDSTFLTTEACSRDFRSGFVSIDFLAGLITSGVFTTLGVAATAGFGISFSKAALIFALLILGGVTFSCFLSLFLFLQSKQKSTLTSILRFCHKNRQNKVCSWNM